MRAEDVTGEEIQDFSRLFPASRRLATALKASRAEVAALRRQLEERSGRSSIQDPADSDLDSVLYDVGGDTGNEFQRRLIRYGVEWARDHFAPSESASREQCDRIAQMLADNPLNRMCDADSDPPPDVATVPRDRLTELVRRFLELAEIAGQIKALAKSDERHIQDAQFRAALAELEGGAK